MSSGEEDGGGTPLQDEPEYGYQLEEAQPPGGTQPFSIGRSCFEDEEEEGEIADEEENDGPTHRRESYTGEDQEDDSDGQLSGEEADDGDVQQRDEESMEDQGSDDDGEIQDSDNDNANMDESNQYPQPEEEEGGDGEINSPMAEDQEGADIRSPSPEGSQEGEEVRSPSPMSDQSDDDDQGPASPAGSDRQSPGGEDSQGPASPSQGSAHSPSEDGGDKQTDNMEVQNQDSQQSSRMSDFETGETAGDNQKNSEYDSAQDSQLDSVVWSETMVEENGSEFVPNQPPFSTHAEVVSEGPQSPSAQGTWSVDSYQGPQSPSNSNQGPQSPSNSDQGPQSPDDGSRGPISPSNSNQGPKSPSFQDDVSQDSVNKDGPTSPSSSNQGPQSPGFQGDGAEGPASPVEKPEEGPASPSSDAEGPRSPSNKDEESRDGSEAGRRGEDEEAKAGSGDEGKKSEDGSEDEKDTKEEHQDVSLDKEGSEKGSEDEDSDKESNVGELIADIFGSSDEEEEFEGFQDADMETPKKKKVAVISDDEGENEAPAEGEGDASAALPQLSDDEGVEDGDKGNFVSDFDLMLERKKEEMRKRRRKRKDFDIINDNDDLIAALINQMKTAAEEDRALNNQSKPAIKKLRMLPEVLQQLRKSDLQGAFLDCGILPALTEWLAPLPDKSLPHLQIREGLLRILQGFPPISSEALKSSGLGKAVMYLYKHPREIRENHERAGKLINEWSRPIFNLTSNYKNLSKEEREQRDYEQLPKKRRISSEGGKTPRRDIDKALAGDQKALRPGDKGWVQRARVPMPSNKDYVVRPHSNLDSDAPRKSSGKKDMSRLEKHMRNFQERKKQNKSQRAVGISIEGRNMSL